MWLRYAVGVWCLLPVHGVSRVPTAGHGRARRGHRARRFWAATRSTARRAQRHHRPHAGIGRRSRRSRRPAKILERTRRPPSGHRLRQPYRALDASLGRQVLVAIDARDLAVAVGDPRLGAICWILGGIWPLPGASRLLPRPTDYFSSTRQTFTFGSTGDGT